MIANREAQHWEIPAADPARNIPLATIKRRPAAAPRFKPTRCVRIDEKPKNVHKIATFEEYHQEHGTENNSAADLVRGPILRKPRWTLPDTYEALKMVNEGYTSKQIAEKLGRTPGGVNKLIQAWRKAHGLGRRKPGRKK